MAPATPPGTAAISVVRLSGREAGPIASRLSGEPIGAAPPRQARRRLLRDPEGRPVDDALVLWFPAPGSYTGEDVVEFHLHGNPVIVARVVELCVAAGAQPAGPGAFTRRAMLAGKMGLPEAEALGELLEAVHPRGAAAAIGRLQGTLRRFAEAIRSDLVDLRARLEALVDFPEEDVDPKDLAAIGKAANEAALRLRREAESAARARIWTRGACVVLAGAPNAGKSTLLNRLVGHERALVSETAGTTRDWIEVGTRIGDVPIRLLDTAGLRAAADPVEAAGVARTAEQLAGADLVVLVRAPGTVEDAHWAEVVAGLPPANRLVVWNKQDIAEPPPGVDLAVSAARDIDLAPLAAAIAERLAPPDEDPVVGTLRQEQACLAAADHLEQAAMAVVSTALPELAAEDLRLALQAMAELVGEVEVEEVLDRLFSSFCIGK